MTIDAATGSKIESCLDAARACSEALAYMRITPELAADKSLANGLSEAARVASLTADCIERVPEIRDMVLRVCVEVAERVALACASHRDQPELLACGEALAACGAICTGAPEIEMSVDMAAATAPAAHAGFSAH
jgi:hypothetical protein